MKKLCTQIRIYLLEARLGIRLATLAGCVSLINSASAMTTNVVFQDYMFTPSSVTIQVGDTVVWSNAGGFHTVTGDGKDPFCCSNAIPSTCSETFTNAGTFPYHCEFHASLGMRGTVIVNPAITNTNPNNNYVQRNLVSDQPGQADLVETNLVNPWGLAFSSSSPFWVSDNHSGLSTLYNTTGGVQKLVVTIPPPPGGSGPAAPSGIVFNGTTNFVVGGQPARFIFDTEDGTISGWNAGTNAVLVVDNSTNNAVYKGLAEASNRLFAANFRAGTVDVFDASFAPVTTTGGFVDPTMPTNYAPFNVAAFGGKLYVTYAQQDADKMDDVAGPGNGFVDLYDLEGNLQRRLISNGPLNSPWGMAMAPSSFGAFPGALLIGNFGDGAINAFDPASGSLQGSLQDSTGTPITIAGLWSIEFGNGGQGGDPNLLYFTAGPGDESHGLFGSLSPAAYLKIFSIQHTSGGLAVTLVGGTPPYQIEQKANPADINWSKVLITTNLSAVLPQTNSAGFFRVVDHATGTVP